MALDMDTGLMYDLNVELKKLDVGDIFVIRRKERQSSLKLLRQVVEKIEKKLLTFFRIEVDGEDWIIRRIMFEKDKAMPRKPRGSIDPSVRVKTTVGQMLTPEQIAQGGSEHAHQSGLMQWVNMVWKHPLGHLLFAVPNGGDRQAHVGASMKAEGVKKGVPDLCWPVPRSNETDALYERITYCGLWIEMKVPGREKTKDGGCSPEQVKWHRDLIDQGYTVAVAYGWQAAAWVLALYCIGDLNPPVDENGIKQVIKATPMIATPPTYKT